MNRSAQPFPSGARTNAGELSMPRKRSSLWKSRAMYWLPWSWRTERPRADREAAGDLLREAAEVPPHPLAERLERLEPVGTVAGVDADALGRAVVGGDEDRGLTLAGDRGGQVGAPHHVDRLGDDRAVVGARAARRAGPRRGEQVGLPHQPQHAPPRGAGTAVAQAGPDLAVALAVEGARGQHRPDRLPEGGGRQRA